MRFVALRKFIYILSLLIIIPGLVSLCWPGRDALNYGIDFRGGSVMEVKFDQMVPSRDVRDVLAQFDLDKDAQIQRSGPNEMLIKTRDLSPNESISLKEALQQNFSKIEVLRNDKVGPAFSKELTTKAVYSVLIACALTLIYISVRFEFNFGVGAIVALLHDVLIILGVFSLLRLEVDSSFVAAVLTVLGYSVMDTIVVFDRIRENMRQKEKDSYQTIVDSSIMQTLNRSVNTVLTVVICLVALLIFGGAAIKTFIIALLIGVISGCYSSIFVASPIWYDLKMREIN
ncbi:MAG: protein translocase subunit SecF [Ignavibacteriales bacterium]